MFEVAVWLGRVYTRVTFEFLAKYLVIALASPSSTLLRTVVGANSLSILWEQHGTRLN